jgi:RNA polymerase sigma factor (sigma-70 family)
MGSLLRYLRRAELVRAGGLTDGQLLECFVAHREDAAFEALLRRHGPMVLAVCRRVLNNWHDAEDAFQATFLVLARKAASVLPRERVGNWLHGVAYRTALKAVSTNAKRRAKERLARQVPRPEGDGDPGWQELQHVLDQEVDRLPAKYRAPIVLCDLEGKTRREAARLLGWPVGTVSTRILAGRARLAQRLARRTGETLSAGGLAVALAGGEARASVPKSLLAVTVTAARGVRTYQSAAAGVISAKVAALMEGVVKAMLISKLKIAAVIVLGLAVLGAGAGWVADRTLAAAPQDAPKDVKPLGPDKKSHQRRNDPLIGDTRKDSIADKKDDSDDPETRKDDLERKLSELRKQTEKLTKQQGILEIEIAVKKLKQSRDSKDEQKALQMILQAVTNYRVKVLKEGADKVTLGK